MKRHHRRYHTSESSDDESGDERRAKRGAKSGVKRGAQDGDESGDENVDVFPGDIACLTKDSLRVWDSKDRSQTATFTTGLLDSGKEYLKYCEAASSENETQLCSVLGIDSENLMKHRLKSSPYKPAFYVALDDKKKRIVLCVRGTKNFFDALTDADVTPCKFLSGFAHGGFLRACDLIYEETKNLLLRLKNLHRDFDVRIVGHSLGGGVASLITLKLKKDIPSVRGVVFGCPPCISESLLEQSKSCITGFVNGNDIVPRLRAGSLISIIKLVMEILYPNPDERPDCSSLEAENGNGLVNIVCGVKKVVDYVSSNSSKNYSGEGDLKAVIKVVTDSFLNSSSESLKTVQTILRRISYVASTESVQIPLCLRKLIDPSTLTVVQITQKIIDWVLTLNNLPSVGRLLAELTETIKKLLEQYGMTSSQWDLVKELADLVIAGITGESAFISSSVNAITSFVTYVSGSVAEGQDLNAPGNVLQLVRCTDEETERPSKKRKASDWASFVRQNSCECTDLTLTSASNLIELSFAVGSIDHHFVDSYLASLESLLNAFLSFVSETIE